MNPGRSNSFPNHDPEGLRRVLDSVCPVCVTGFDHRILTTNLGYRNAFGDPGPGGFCHDSRPGPSCFTENCPLVKIEAGAEEYCCEATKAESEDPRTFLVTARPLFNGGGEPVGVVESFQDISLRKAMETEQKRLIGELEEALTEVRVLRGLLPICAACKKVRDEEGLWSEVETYISQHTAAEFTHSMCPDCMKTYYPKHYKGK